MSQSGAGQSVAPISRSYDGITRLTLLVGVPMTIHWYAHYLGDYAKDTRHLTLLEHGAYRLLLDLYYSNGGPIEDDRKSIWRSCGAHTPAERRAVDKILSNFFSPQNGFWSQKRASAEISRKNEISELRKKSAANAHANAQQTTMQNEGNHNHNHNHNHKDRSGDDEKLIKVNGHKLKGSIVTHEAILKAAQIARQHGWNGEDDRLGMELEDIFLKWIKTEPRNPDAAFLKWVPGFLANEKQG